MSNMMGSGPLANSQMAPSSNQNKLIQLNSGQFEDYLVQALNDSLMKKSKCAHSLYQHTQNYNLCFIRPHFFRNRYAICAAKERKIFCNYMPIYEII